MELGALCKSPGAPAASLLLRTDGVGRCRILGCSLEHWEQDLVCRTRPVQGILL